MIHYESLPKGTPGWLKLALFWLGGALGVAIGAESMVALYGLSAFLFPVFFPSAPAIFSQASAVSLGISGAVGAIAAGIVIMMAIDMNGLSKRALNKAHYALLLLSLTAAHVTVNSLSTLPYRYTPGWVFAAWAAAIFGGLLPWLVLRTTAARKLHKR
jgi:membrane associated rhomboid family serine protease